MRERHDFLLRFSFVAVPDCWLEVYGLGRFGDVGIIDLSDEVFEEGCRTVWDFRLVLMGDRMVGRSTVVSLKLQLLFSTTALRSRLFRAAHLANDIVANGSAACSCDEVSQKV